MQIFTVTRIDEQMYGCEELPEGQTPLCDVTLRAADGTEQMLAVPDALLYRRDINEGDAVCIDPALGLIKKP